MISQSLELIGFKSQKNKTALGRNAKISFQSRLTNWPDFISLLGFYDISLLEKKSELETQKCVKVTHPISGV